MTLRILLALVGLVAGLHFGAPRAAAYDLGDFNWCFNTMPKVYDQAFDACVDANCTRISNKKVSRKQGCYQSCKGEAVDACLSQRAQGSAPKAVMRAAPSPAPAAENTGRNPIPAAAREGTAGQSAPDNASAPAQGEREGFFSRLLGGFGGQPEQPASPPAAATSGAAPAQTPKGESRREGFFTRIANGLSEGITDGFDGDYNWCRDHSGGHFQDLLQDCTRGCLAGPSGSASKRQGCIQSCRSSSVRACIARRDGK
ncbi:MAG: hypothetical protein RIG67_17085 [Rhodospirillales bacterium]